MPKFHVGFLMLALFLAVVTMVASILAYPTWIESLQGILQLIGLVAVGVVGFIVAFRKAFEKQKDQEPPTEYLRQLPSPVRDFTGRKTLLDNVIRKIRKERQNIVAFFGIGGIGKTEFALKLAEEIKKYYGDGHIYMDMKGASEQEPLTPEEAMAHVILAFQPEAALPEDDNQLRARYNALLDGKKVLLLIDNALSAEQVEPLIPHSDCLMLVTSRQQFALPGMYNIEMDRMTRREARDLLLTIEPRIGDKADAIAERCTQLPLALRLAGSAMVERPDLSPTAYLRRLEGEQTRLELVEASLRLSYDLLDEKLQKKWRALAVFLDTFDRAAAAAVWDMEEDGSHDALGRLVGYSLLEWNEETRRYRMHDLARVYADSLLSDEERYKIQYRHAKHYRDELLLATRLLLRGGKDFLRGLSLFDLEQSNIETGQGWAAQNYKRNEEIAELCSNYAHAWSILDLRLHPATYIEWIDSGLAAARQRNDKAAEGAHLGNLGIAYNNLGKVRRAIEYFEQVLEIMREVDDRQGEGNALGNLGIAYRRLGEVQQAIEYYERQLEIVREIGDRRGEGNALNNLGLAYADLGETRKAIEHYKKSLEIKQDTGDRRGEGSALGSLGKAYAVLRETRRAIEYFEQDLEIAREIGHRQGEESALGNMGNAYTDLGEARRAINHYEQALEIAREIGDRRGEGNALWNSADEIFKLGDKEEAIRRAEAALAIYEQIEDPNAEMVRKALDKWRGEV